MTRHHLLRPGGRRAPTSAAAPTFTRLPYTAECGICRRLICDQPAMCRTLQRLVAGVVRDDANAIEQLRATRRGNR